jgi:cell wall assembly regulator SMI1
MRIGSAERALGVRFPPAFRAFLIELGSGGAGSEEFIGLGGPSHLDVVQATLWARQSPRGFPPTLIPLRRDGFGNYDCLDLDCETESSCPVVEWVHEAPNGQRRVLAPDYEAWFASILEMAAED